MASRSQVGNLESVADGDLSGLVHEVYAGEVKPNVQAQSPTAQMFSQAGRGQYRLDGEKLVGSAQLTYSMGAMGTDGNLPDSQYTDSKEWEVTPARIYVRRAIDNFVEARGRKGPGAFDDFLERLYDQMWDAFGRTMIRHAIGTSDGTICKIDSRTDADTIEVKDGYGHVGTNPTMHLEPGGIIAWIDVSSSNAVGGAAEIDSISGTTVNLVSSANWERNGTPASGDLIVQATTPNTTDSHFATEFQNAKHGVLDIVDPDANATTVFNISESNFPRWKPFREASSGFDHIELTEHWQKLRAQSTYPVGPQTHAVVMNGAPHAELARTLTGFQQDARLGRTFEGGYQAVRIAGQDIVVDDWWLHDVVLTLCLEDLFKVDLDGGADYFAEDGSQFQRLADFDGKEWYVREYCQYFSDRRNRHSALTGISLPNVTADDFNPSPY